MNEENSVDFYFVSRRHMEHNIQNNKLVEHAFYEGHYYGTSIDSIRKVINEGKTCLLIVAPQSIRSVRTPEIKPFLVYLKPPTADFMKQNWVQQKRIKVFYVNFLAQCITSYFSLQESSIADLIRQATHLEQTYGHYIDHTLLFSNLDSAQQDIMHITNRLRRDQQWVPASWANLW